MEELFQGNLEFHRPTAEELEAERAAAEAAAAQEVNEFDALLADEHSDL
jgi:hypothetical protein